MSLFESLQEIYEFETKAIKPEKSTGTRWLDHKVRGMEKLNDKFGIYATQIKNSIKDRKCSSRKVERVNAGRCRSSKCSFNRKNEMI